MKLLVIGSGMMGSAAAYDMARQPDAQSVTLADADLKRARDVAARINRLRRDTRSSPFRRVQRKSRGQTHEGPRCGPLRSSLLSQSGHGQGSDRSALPPRGSGRKQYSLPPGLALSSKAEKRGVALAPDCGLSPGMASILGGELVNRLGGRADARRLCVGGLPEKPLPPFHYQLAVSVEGLINEYVEPARILRKGKLVTIEPLTEPEEFQMHGFSPLVAFHTWGGTSTLPESVRRQSRGVLRENSALSGPLQPVMGAERIGSVFRPEDEDRQGLRSPRAR